MKNDKKAPPPLGWRRRAQAAEQTAENLLGIINRFGLRHERDCATDYSGAMCNCGLAQTYFYLNLLRQGCKVVTYE